MEYLSEKKIKYQIANLKQLIFETTESCNLQCKYCGYGEFYNDYDKRENKNLSVENALKLINYLIPLWQSDFNTSSNKHIYISFYGGEPLLNFTFIQQIVEYIEKINISTIRFIFSMTTNGTLLKKYMKYLVEKDFNLMISLDGNRDNNAYRLDKSGKSSFVHILKNINLLQNNYPDFFNKNVNFNAVLHNNNSVADIHFFFKQKYNKIPMIGELNNMGIRPNKIQDFMRAYKNQFESLQQAEHYEEIEKERFVSAPSYLNVCIFLHQHSNFVFKDYCELLYGKTESVKWVTGTCFPFSKKMYLTVTGKILPCERIGHQFALGQVGARGVELDFEDISKKYNLFFAKLENQCVPCYNKKTCMQCIFNIDNIEEKPICYGFMTEDDFKQYVKQNMDFIAKHPADYYKIMEEVIYE